jgi:hypothetical protein
MNEEFTASIADIKSGHGLETGKNQPVTTGNAAKKSAPETGKRRRR